MTEQVYQPRYLAYCHAEGLTPECAEARDGSNAPFMEWIRARWAEWRKLRGIPPNAPIAEAHHVDFDAWLSSRADPGPSSAKGAE